MRTDKTTERAPMAAGSIDNKKPYSVLLLYPEDMTDRTVETFYDWVWALDAKTAIAESQRHAQKANPTYPKCGADFHPLLVLPGHHYGELI